MTLQGHKKCILDRIHFLSSEIDFLFLFCATCVDLLFNVTYRSDFLFMEFCLQWRSIMWRGPDGDEDAFIQAWCSQHRQAKPSQTYLLFCFLPKLPIHHSPHYIVLVEGLWLFCWCISHSEKFKRLLLAFVSCIFSVVLMSLKKKG